MQFSFLQKTSTLIVLSTELHLSKITVSSPLLQTWNSLNMVICSFVSFCVGAFHVKSIKNGEIYMTVFDFMKFGVSVHEFMHPTNF